jgi:hypothetical protein|tara:strand:- start:96 stop:956 length:861 start_codon:yes stop_codon:yes gene_type:complete
LAGKRTSQQTFFAKFMAIISIVGTICTLASICIWIFTRNDSREQDTLVHQAEIYLQNYAHQEDTISEYFLHQSRLSEIVEVLNSNGRPISIKNREYVGIDCQGQNIRSSLHFDAEVVSIDNCVFEGGSVRLSGSDIWLTNVQGRPEYFSIKLRPRTSMARTEWPEVWIVKSEIGPENFRIQSITSGRMILERFNLDATYANTSIAITEDRTIFGNEIIEFSLAIKGVLEVVGPQDSHLLTQLRWCKDEFEQFESADGEDFYVAANSRIECHPPQFDTFRSVAAQRR